ncbi:hypothetical protein [Haloplanus sp. C73]
MTHVRITDDYLDRTIPVDSTVGTIEIDLSGDDVTIVLPPDAPVSIEHE